MEKFELNVAAFGRLSDEEFFHFCRDNEVLRIERDTSGKIIIMPPVIGRYFMDNFDIVLNDILA